jgi:transposase InsO family protein
MRDHLRAELAIAALSMAIQRQRPAPGLIHHSDRGSQYAAADYCRP